MSPTVHMPLSHMHHRVGVHNLYEQLIWPFFPPLLSVNLLISFHVSFFMDFGTAKGSERPFCIIRLRTRLCTARYEVV